MTSRLNERRMCSREQPPLPTLFSTIVRSLVLKRDVLSLVIAGDYTHGSTNVP